MIIGKLPTPVNSVKSVLFDVNNGKTQPFLFKIQTENLYPYSLASALLIYSGFKNSLIILDFLRENVFDYFSNFYFLMQNLK